MSTDSELANGQDEAKALRVYQQMIAPYQKGPRTRGGKNTVAAGPQFPPESQLRDTFTQTLSRDIDRGDGTELQRSQELYHRIRTTSLSREINTPIPAWQTLDARRRYAELLQVQEQISRLVQDQSASRVQNVAMAACGFAAKQERGYLTDQEAQVIAEYSINHRAKRLQAVGFMAVVASYFTWAGRKAFRFPFTTVKYSPRFSPFTNPRLRTPYHFLRGIAYFAACYFTVGDIYLLKLHHDTSAEMKKDPRLTDLLKEKVDPSGNSTGQQFPQLPPFASPAGTEVSGNEQWSESRHRKPRWEKADAFEERENPDKPQQIYQAPANAYSAPSNEGLSSPNWEAPLDEVDDASPVAAAARNQQGAYSSSGSAWDRLRQKAGNTSSPQQNPASGSYPEYGGATQSYPSGAGADKTSAKSREQQNFDRLLDQERSGADQERSNWSSR